MNCIIIGRRVALLSGPIVSLLYCGRVTLSRCRGFVVVGSFVQIYSAYIAIREYRSFAENEILLNHKYYWLSAARDKNAST